MLALACTQATAQPASVPLDAKGIDSVDPAQIEALFDSSGRLTYEEVVSSPWREHFQSRADADLNFGVTQDALWIRFSIINSTPLRNWILLVDNPRLERVELFIRSSSGKVQRMLSGEGTPFDLRPLPGREVAFPLTLATGERVEAYARIATAATISVPLQVLTPRQYERQARISAFTLTIIIGAMMLLLVVALLGLREYPGARMVAYTAMVSVQLVFVLIQDGLGTEYLWPDHPDWTIHIKLFFIYLLAPVALYYTSVALNFRNYAPKLHPLALALVALGILGALSSPWLPGQFVNRTATLLSGISAALLLGAIPYTWLRGNREARAFFLSGLPLILSALSVLAHNHALFHLSTAYVLLMYKLTYLLFLSLQLFHSLGRSRVERREETRAAHRIQLWRKVSSAIPEAQTPAPDRPVLIHTLGRYEVWHHGTLARFASRGVSRQQLMLALILAGNAHGANRATILDTLWPDSEGDLAEKSFRTSLYRLRQTIGAEAIQQSGTLLSLNVEMVWIDSAEFETLAANLIRAFQTGAEPHLIERAQIALHTYQGDFLPGFDTPSVLVRREHLRRLFHELVMRVATHHLKNNDAQSALDIYRRGLDYSEPDESLFQGELRCYLAMEQHAAGLAAYEHCRTFLQQHYNTPPSAETERLKHALSEQTATPGRISPATS